MLIVSQRQDTSTPGNQFAAERGGRSEDIPGGRRFRLQPNDTLILIGTVQVPPAAIPKMRRLVIHFRTSPSGPALYSVELRNGTYVEYGTTRSARQGDYIAKEIIGSNAWDFKPPIAIHPPLLVRLEVGLAGGFEGGVSPGDFVLANVKAEFERKPLSLPGTSTTTNVTPPIAAPIPNP